MGRPLDRTVFNAEAKADQVTQSGNIEKLTSGQDRERMTELEAKTWEELTHSEKKEIYRISNYYNVDYDPYIGGGGGGGGSLPDGADGIADFINNYYDFGSGSVDASTIISNTASISSNGLDFALMSNAVAMTGDLLTLATSNSFTIVVEWEEVKTTTAGQPILLSIGSAEGANPFNYMILQNLGGVMPNQMYWLEFLAGETLGRDAISDFTGDQHAVVGINRIAVGIDDSNVRAAVNGNGYLDTAEGAGSRLAQATFNVASFAGWTGSSSGTQEQKIREVVFYPVTFDLATLETYSTP